MALSALQACTLSLRDVDSSVLEQLASAPPSVPASAGAKGSSATPLLDAMRRKGLIKALDPPDAPLTTAAVWRAEVESSDLPAAAISRNMSESGSLSDATDVPPYAPSGANVEDVPPYAPSGANVEDAADLLGFSRTTSGVKAEDAAELLGFSEIAATRSIVPSGAGGAAPAGAARDGGAAALGVLSGGVQKQKLHRPCAGCRATKVKCDRELPCSRCRRFGIVCVAPPTLASGRPRAYVPPASRRVAVAARRDAAVLDSTPETAAVSLAASLAAHGLRLEAPASATETPAAAADVSSVPALSPASSVVMAMVTDEAAEEGLQPSCWASREAAEAAHPALWEAPWFQQLLAAEREAPALRRDADALRTQLAQMGAEPCA